MMIFYFKLYISLKGHVLYKTLNALVYDMSFT